MRDDLTRRAALSLLAAGALAPRAATAALAAPHLRRGINLHHLLNWPEVTRSGGTVQYVWPPFQDAVHSIGDGELRRIVAAGFDFARITVDPSIFIATTEPTREATLMAQARTVVRRVLDAGLNVVFDLHPVAVNPAYGPDPLVKSGATVLFNAYADAVGRVAAMLREFPPNRVVFELMNEPWIKQMAEAPRWQAMLELLHQRARAAAPNLPLILTGILWSDAKALLRVDTAPFRSSNVLYTFHYYDPHTFTHQGVGGDEAQYIAGLAWPESAAHAAGVADAATGRIEADPAVRPDMRERLEARTRQLIDNVLAGGYDARHITDDFAAVAGWAARNGLSHDKILLGEFGCVVASRGVPVGESRYAWLAAVRRAAEKQGFGWAYWAYKGYGGMELIKADAPGSFDPKVAAALGLSPT